MEDVASPNKNAVGRLRGLQDEPAALRVTKIRLESDECKNGLDVVGGKSLYLNLRDCGPVTPLHSNVGGFFFIEITLGTIISL